MTRPYPHWKVRPHGNLSKIDDGILTVTGPIRMPLGSFPRRMTVVRLRRFTAGGVERDRAR